MVKTVLYVVVFIFQLVLTLAAVVNIAELRERLEKELNVARARFRIRHGFPPRLLDAPDTDTNALPIQNGDRINVEILPDPNEGKIKCI